MVADFKRKICEDHSDSLGRDSLCGGRQSHRNKRTTDRLARAAKRHPTSKENANDEEKVVSPNCPDRQRLTIAIVRAVAATIDAAALR